MGYQVEGMKCVHTLTYSCCNFLTCLCSWLYYKWWRGENCILADDMGLGKTIQIISFLSILFQEQKIWPFLIVVPHSTVANWKHEIQLWNPNLTVAAYYGSAASRRLTVGVSSFNIFILLY